MDIIDILMAKKLASAGSPEASAARARQAVSDATAAVNAINSITQQTNTNNTNAAKALEDANAALATVNEALENLEAPNIKLYETSGQNTDGAMTQKAVTDLVGSVNASVNLGANNSGKLVMIGNDGSLTPSNATNAQLLGLLNANPVAESTGIVGLEIDYANKTFTRLYDAAGLTMGPDFNQFKMYGGRMRCNVAANGAINAFYGESGYRDDGSNGQVMVYQPAFYYKRIPITTEETSQGTIIRKEQLLLSYTAKEGFTKHWFFRNLDYGFLPAYEGSLIDGKLQSIAGQTPATGFTSTQAENYAMANGDGWHMTSMDMESVNQMLLIVESGQLNGQQAIELGISNTNSILKTGSTAELGNSTGHAASSTDGTNTYTDNGKRAISYRGFENPWGNLWRLMMGVAISGDGYKNGGEITIGNVPIGFNLPNTSGWISAMGLANSDYDWVFIPIECSSNANSLLPVGDNIWVIPNINRPGMIAVGGAYNQSDNNGPFYYACDRTSDYSAPNYGARIKFSPSNNSIYTANIAKWNNLMGG